MQHDDVTPPPFAKELNIKQILSTLVASWRAILITAAACGTLGAIYAFLLASPVYRSKAVLIPTESQKVDQLGAAALLVSKKSGGMSEDVSLYRSLLSSRTVARRLLRMRIANQSDTANGRIEPVFQILKIDTTKRRKVVDAEASLSKVIQVDGDEGGGGVVTVGFDASAPWLAQVLCDSTIQIGQELIREVRAERFIVTMGRLASAVDTSRKEWDLAASRMTDFRIANRSIDMPEKGLEQMRLNMDLQAKEQRFLIARKELEMQELQAEKATPPMILLEHPDIPVAKLRPKRLTITLIFLILGAFLSATYVLLLHGTNVKNDLRDIFRGPAVAPSGTRAIS